MCKWNKYPDEPIPNGKDLILCVQSRWTEWIFYELGFFKNGKDVNPELQNQLKQELDILAWMEIPDWKQRDGKMGQVMEKEPNELVKDLILALIKAADIAGNMSEDVRLSAKERKSFDFLFDRLINERTKICQKYDKKL